MLKPIETSKTKFEKQNEITKTYLNQLTYEVSNAKLFNFK